MITAQCVLLFLWVLGLSYRAWICAKGQPAKPPGSFGDFMFSFMVSLWHLYLLWRAGALSNLIGGAP